MRNVGLRYANPTYKKGLKLYQAYQDKTWGLIGCVSFVVIRDMEMTDALTFDKHFAQAGFNILRSE